MDFVYFLIWIMQLSICFSYVNSENGNEKDASKHFVPCKEGWIFYGDKCYKVLGKGKPLNWKQASLSCFLEKGHLATIDSKELQDFLIASVLLVAKSNVWIGFHDRATESQFEWDDGSPVNFTNWDLNQPTEKGHRLEQEDCVEMRYSDPRIGIGAWNDLACVRELPYLCQTNKSEEFLSVDPQLCTLEEGGGFRFFNSCFHIVPDRKSWEEAEEYCGKNFNGFLATILSKQVEIFLNYLMPNTSKDFWIGIKIQSETVQKWASGWHVAYKNWDPEMNRLLDGTCGTKSKNNVWSVAPCFHELPFICERLKYNVPVSSKHSSIGGQCPDQSKEWLDLDGEFCYIFETKMKRNWFEANYECNRKGGFLASIHSDMESNKLHPHLIDTIDKVFFGLHRNFSRRDIFEWVDGSPLDYTNWGESEPNNLREECGEIWTDSMKWNDVSCGISKGYICSAKKIPPNNDITSSASKDYGCASQGSSAKALVTIIICILLVALLTGVVVYYFRIYFRKRQHNDYIRKDFSSTAQISFSQVSTDPILKPEDLERLM